MTLPYLAVKDFEKHQHYRDRRPPWIKFYGAVLTDPELLQLPEPAQAQLFKLWLLASQFGNPLPNNPKLLAGKIGTTGRFYLKELIASGYLIPTENAASPVLAEPEQDASGSVRARGESAENRVQSSESSSSASAARLRLLELLGNTDAAQQEVDAFLAGLPNDTKRLGWARNLVTSIEDGSGHPIPPAVMLLALADFNLADRTQFPYNGALFRAFVERAAKPKLERTEPRKTAPDDDAQIAVTAIRAMVEQQGTSKYIKRERVEALGPQVLAAYLSLGGAEKFLTTPPDKLHFLVRDFATALRTTHAA